MGSVACSQIAQYIIDSDSQTAYAGLPFRFPGSAEEIIGDFPELTHEDIKACLSYAADIDKHTQLVHSA